MSGDTNELRRSTLQRKDRDELVAIATAMGAPPSSRARKAEIVELILDAAAGSDDSGDSDDAEAAAGSGTRTSKGKGKGKGEEKRSAADDTSADADVDEADDADAGADEADDADAGADEADDADADDDESDDADDGDRSDDRSGRRSGRGGKGSDDRRDDDTTTAGIGDGGGEAATASAATTSTRVTRCRSRVISTCGRRATGSCAPPGFSPRATMPMSRCARSASSVCAAGIIWWGPAVQPGATRRTRRWCTSSR